MIDVLERITEMREARQWTEYQLSEKAGLTQSTISSWYRKGLFPTIPSLIKICDAFEISLAQFFQDEEDRQVLLTDRQRELLSALNKLNSVQCEALLLFLQSL